MTDAERLFNQVFKRWIDSYAFILSFRTTSELGMRAAKERIRSQRVTFVNELIQGGEYDKILIDKPAFFKAIPPERLVHIMTEETVQKAQLAVDAASIVFAHSILDGATSDYCRVTALVAPRDWESLLDQRQVKLSEVRELGYEQALKNKIDEFFEQLERESLLKKADLLFARCRPPEKWSSMRGYAFDRDRLQRLDDYRHGVIHGDSLKKGIENAAEEVEYLMRSVLFFMGLVNLRYKLTLDPYYSMTGNEIPAPIPPAGQK